MLKKSILIISLLLFSCEIETDIVINSPDVFREISISSEGSLISEIALMKNATKQLSVVYKENGQTPLNSIISNWTSSNPLIATVSDEGLVTAVSSGQTTIRTNFKKLESSIQITVVMTESAVSKVEIQSISKLNYEAGESVQLSAKIYDLTNTELSGKSISWTSSNTTVARISTTGFVNFLTDGNTTITATVESVNSMQLQLTVMDMSTMLTGSFSPVGGHNVSGDVSLVQSGSDLILSLKSNFSSQSGPDLYITLATDASSYSSSDYTVQSIASSLSGARSYTIPNKTISDFKYVHVWCKPFNIVFGSAQLN